jgi:hypothetical protein
MRHFEDKKDWKTYNEKLVKRGEMYVSFGFLESWAEDLESMNTGKVGPLYRYPELFVAVLGLIHITLGVDYRGLEGSVRGLSRLLPSACA